MEGSCSITVEIAQEHQSFTILQSVALRIPYLHTRINTDVGRKRKNEPEIVISLPENCTVRAMEAILARMSCSERELYNQSFHWKINNIADVVSLVTTADFLLLVDLVTELLKQGRMLFRRPEDASPLAGLSHPAVQDVIQRLGKPAGKISSAMSKGMIIKTCRNNLGAESLVNATVKIASQWLSLTEHAKEEIDELAEVVFSQLRSSSALADELVKHEKFSLRNNLYKRLFYWVRDNGLETLPPLVEQISKHGTFNLKNALGAIPDAFFDGDEIRKYPASCEVLAKFFIRESLRDSEAFPKVVSAIFRDNKFTVFGDTKKSYLDFFEYYFHDRLLTVDELDYFLNHICSKVFHPLVRTSVVFAESVRRMDHEHHSIIAKIIDGGQYRIVSKQLMLDLCPESRLKVVAAVMPDLVHLDTESQAWITKSIEDDLF